MTLVAPPVDLAEEAFYARAVGNRELTDELGHVDTDERIKRQRPREVLGKQADPAAGDFPLLTYFGVTGPEPLEGFAEVRIQADMWVWPEGGQGGIDKLKAVDTALRSLFYREQWTWDGKTFDSSPAGWRSGPAPAERDRPMQRTREFAVGVNLGGT